MIGFLAGLVTTVATAAAILTLAAVVGFLLVYFYLAPRNYFFTFVKEGSAKVIVRADKFEKALIQWKDHKLNKNNVIDGEESKGLLRGLFGGLRFYGIWPLHDVYIYDFEWTSVKENGKPNPHSKETLDYILLKEDVYWAKIEQAEDKDLLPLDVEIVMPIRIVNPYKALFNVENWLEAVIARVAPGVRDVITTDKYENLIKNPTALGKKIFKLLKKRQIKEFEKNYGVKVMGIEVKEIDPPTEQRAASLQKYLAERDKEKVEIAAKAEKFRLETVAEGEKNRIEKVYGQIDKMGDIGKLKAILEAMEKTSVAGIYAIPGLMETLGKALNKPAEKISPEDIAIFKNIIKKEIAKSKKPKPKPKSSVKKKKG